MPNFIRGTRASLITRPTFMCKNYFRHATPRFQLRIIRGRRTRATMLHNSFAGRAPNFIRRTHASLITRLTFVCKNNLRHAAPRFIFQHGL